MSSKPNYMCTYDGVNLTNEQRDFYEQNGYIIIHSLVDHGMLDEFRLRFLDICDGKVEKGRMIIMKDISLKNKNANKHVIYKIQDFNVDDILFKYVVYPPILDVVKSIIGPNITAWNTMLINKPPATNQNSSRHPLHQDLFYVPIRPARSLVASWTAMERIDESNGCLFVIPGTHKGPLHNHAYPPDVKNKMFYGVSGFDDCPKVNLIMEKGDTVFLHPLLLHGSGPNLSKGCRKAMSTHYADSNCHFIDVRGTSQDLALTEIKEVALKYWKFPKLTFNDIFGYKSRLVHGDPGNLQRFESQL